MANKRYFWQQDDYSGDGAKYVMAGLISVIPKDWRYQRVEADLQAPTNRKGLEIKEGTHLQVQTDKAVFDMEILFPESAQVNVACYHASSKIAVHRDIVTRLLMAGYTGTIVISTLLDKDDEHPWRVKIMYNKGTNVWTVTFYSTDGPVAKSPNYETFRVVIDNPKQWILYLRDSSANAQFALSTRMWEVTQRNQRKKARRAQ